MNHAGALVQEPAVISPAFSRPRVSPLEAVVRNAVRAALQADDDRGLQQVLQIDPLTTARYLRVANSPLLGRKRRVGSAVAALDLLGRRAAAMIAMVSSFDYGLSSRRRENRLEFTRCHSLQTAVLARHAAASVGLAAQAEELFVAGQLHDIAGMLGRMGNGMGDGDAAADYHTAWQSAELLSAWHLPAGIVDAIAGLGRAHDFGFVQPGSAGHLLWVVHDFTHLVTLQHEPEHADVAALARCLATPVGEALAAVRAARLDYAQIQKLCA